MIVDGGWIGGVIPFLIDVTKQDHWDIASDGFVA
jgi:hypothetical protein